MRIVQACVRYPPAPGGAETHVREISERLAARGHEVIVHTTDLVKEVPFTRRRDGWPASDAEGAVRVHRHAAWTPGKEIHYTFSAGLLAGVLRDARGADVVHAHSYGYWQTVSAALARVGGAPFVFTPHFHPPWSMEGGSKRRALRAVYDNTVSRFVNVQADRIIGVSTGELEEMRKTVGFDPAKTTIIPNGITLERFTPVPDGALFREKFGVRDDAPLVVYAGRLAVNKGLHHLLGAFKRVLREHPDATLALAGEDQDQGPRLERLARELGIRERVLFTGHLSEELYRSALAAGNAFALASEWEAFGIVLAEAMACERPCVATRVGGAPDVVQDGETGYLVPYGDEAALADRLSALLADPKAAAAMGRAGRARVAERFTWDAVVDAIEDAYRDVTRGG